jgi:hypothetical protein
VIELVVPTHGRAGKITTQKNVAGAVLCVSKSQLPLYKEHYPDANYEVHPDDVIGLAAKRQWIMERFGDVFMVDDDIRRVLDLTSVPGKLEYVRPQDVRSIVERCAEMAEDCGAFLYGFAPLCDVRTYNCFKPFRFTGYVPGHSFGVRKGASFWWHKDVIQEDYWICLLNAHYHRLVTVDERYGFYQDATFKATGGLGAHRTRERERQGFEMLKKHFGPAVERKQPKAKREQKKHGDHPMNYAVSHPWQPKMKLPF